MEAVTRLSSIPLVETGLRNAEDVYFRIKVQEKKSLYYYLWLNSLL